MKKKSPQSIAIIGAGPAGLTAGLKLIRANFKVTIIEADPKYVGGIARTVDYKGYKFDIGGHRFLTKNKKIEEIWKKTLGEGLLYRNRLSRIYYEGKFYNYPLTILNALKNLGVIRSTHAILSFFKYKIFPIHPENTYEDWMVNKFGRVLFNIFFKSYTEKVWGIPTNQISKDWAIQRIKTFTLSKAIISSIFKSQQKKFLTLSNHFYYPKLGPGMMWEKFAGEFQRLGGKLVMGEKVIGLTQNKKKKWTVKVTNSQKIYLQGQFDRVISTMPLRSLIHAIEPNNEKVVKIAEKLKYRDFITILLIIDKKEVFKDNWIYIHEPSVKVGRIQNFKNWSPFMVPDECKTSVGMEYFISEDNKLWDQKDSELLEMAKDEVVTLGFCKPSEIIDGKVIKAKKAYPIYDIDYGKNIKIIREFIKTLPNLHIVGRNGMHKYNNQDHSMATALIIANNIIAGRKIHDPWNVNSEAKYIENLENDAGRLVPRKSST
jgi:protoporphyrinogen oxidase